jgi:hypothetical protein
MGFKDFVAYGLRTVASWIATASEPCAGDKRPRESSDDEESGRGAARVRIDEQGVASPVQREVDVCTSFVGTLVGLY